jgi:Ni/Co efflux regulator RcnB
MKRTMTAAAVAALAFASVSGAALAQPRHDHYGPPGHMDDHGHGHGHWRRGDRIDRAEWRHYQRVDWRRHHLHAPPRGYEWREVNGDYVLAAVATGVIASIIASQ